VIPLLFAFLQAAATAAVPGAPAGSASPPACSVSSRHSGLERATEVRPPRLDTTLVVDGALDEAVWQCAVVLTGFSQYSPADGRPAEDSTHVLVWYSGTAIHFGVRAFAPPGTVRATLADRDRISNDDNVQILLDTFDDRRRAFMFAVNPLGVQTDGIRAELAGFFGGGPGGGGFNRATLGSADLSQDYIWQSKGRVTEWGYEVELRVPFKSLRFQASDDQAWGIQVVRQTQRNNFQDTWTPALRGAASFLAQSGKLRGLSELRRGLVLDVTPVVTSLTTGRPDAQDGWTYTQNYELGGDVRWGILPNITLNATVNPDFSQVEADVGQIPGDVRFSLFFPELRPFFVESSEQFDTPNRLVYTRQIVQPQAALKATGKVSGFDLALLSALDAHAASATGEETPWFNILRVRRDVRQNSNIGFTYTDRMEGSDWNRVASLDSRFVLGKLYLLELQAAGSLTDVGSDPTGGPLFTAVFDRTGRSFGFRYDLTGVHPDFQTRAGFVNRTDFVRPQINNRYTWFGRRGARLEQVMSFLSLQGLWSWDEFWSGDTPLETRASLNSSFTIRGGWSASLTPAIDGTRFDPRRYTTYAVEETVGGVLDTVAFTVGPKQATPSLSMRVSTPQYRRFGGSASVTMGQTPEFFETDEVDRLDLDVRADWRPTSQVRVSALYLHQRFDRARDGTRFSTQNIPRLRVEYQLNRAIFFRFVGQYENRERDALRDPASEGRILTLGADGVYRAADAQNTNTMRVDWLFSYVPVPGRVVYLGYGSSLAEDDAFTFSDARRTSDALFVKFSWLYRF
jgi:hypothetical protein